MIKGGAAKQFNSTGLQSCDFIGINPCLHFVLLWLRVTTQQYFFVLSLFNQY